MDRKRSVPGLVMKIVVGVLLVLALVREFWPGRSPPFPKWNCEIQEINIKTGEARFRRYRFFFKTDDETKGTVLSEFVSEPVDVADVPAWQTVNRFAPPSHHVSPHYRFHGALAQVGEVGTIFELNKPTDRQKEEIARQVLTLWQQGGDDSGAGEFIRTIKR